MKISMAAVRVSAGSPFSDINRSGLCISDAGALHSGPRQAHKDPLWCPLLHGHFFSLTPPFLKVPALIFTALLSAYMMSQFFRVFLSVVALDLSRDLGFDSADLGSISAMWFATFALSQFPVGFLLDRHGPRRTLSGLMLIAVIGAGLMAMAQSLTDCLIGMALIGVGCSPVLMSSLFVFGRFYPPERFAMMAAWMIGLGSLGSLISASPLAWSIITFGWRISLAMTAVLTAACVIFCALVLRDPPPNLGAQAPSGLWQGIVRILAIRALWPLMPITFLSYAFVVATRSLWITPFFRDLFHYELSDLGHAAFLMSSAMVVGALAFGPLERWLQSPRLPSLWSGFITAGFFLALGGFGPRNALLSLVLLCGIGAVGLSYGILMAHAKQFFPPDLLGRGVTLLNFLFIAGAGVVQYLSGQIIARAQMAGLDPETLYARLFYVYGGLLLLVSVIYTFSQEKPSGTESDT
jgi:predicted MFS family arabinose efflux permease